jgi:hypothetical protein
MTNRYGCARTFAEFASLRFWPADDAVGLVNTVSRQHVIPKQSTQSYHNATPALQARTARWAHFFRNRQKPWKFSDVFTLHAGMRPKMTACAWVAGRILVGSYAIRSSGESRFWAHCGGKYFETPTEMGGEEVGRMKSRVFRVSRPPSVMGDEAAHAGLNTSIPKGGRVTLSR